MKADFHANDGLMQNRLQLVRLSNKGSHQGSEHALQQIEKRKLDNV